MLADGVLDLSKTEPGKTCAIPLPQSWLQLRSFGSDECWATVSFTLKSGRAWADKGHEIAWFQQFLNGVASPASRPHSIPKELPEITVKSSPRTFSITGKDFSISFDRGFGRLDAWCHRGQRILAPQDRSSSSANCRVGFWRPPTDNDDAWQTKQWKHWGLDNLTVQNRSIKLFTTSSCEVMVKSVSYISPPILAWGFLVDTEYRIRGDGSLHIKVHIKPEGSCPATLPRIGWEFKLPITFDHAAWFGLGSGESYHDKKSAQKVGIYRASIDDLHTPYEVPQENGNRMDTRWLEILDAGGVGFKATMKGSQRTPDMFHFAASRYSARELERARHAPDLKKDDAVHLRLDLDVAGVGTGACGPATNQEDLVKCEEAEFEIYLEPVLGS